MSELVESDSKSALVGGDGAAPEAPQKSIVQATELGRWYGEVVGLGDLSVEIGSGITGLVGPNGAGKSTFMKLLVGEIRPSRGRIRVLGQDPFANLELFRKIGFCPQQDALYEHLSGREFVRELLRLAGFAHAQADQRAVRAMQRVHLEEQMDRRVSGYSKGMRQRTKIAQSIAHDPLFLIADEPLTGLDPVARRQVMTLFEELAAEGTSILISSHVLHELQSMTQEIVLIHRGRLLAQGPVEEIRKLISRHPRQVHLIARRARALAAALIELETVRGVRVEEDGETLTIDTFHVDALFDALPELAARIEPGIRKLVSTDAGLEAVFDYLVG